MFAALFQQDYRIRRDRQKALDLVTRHGDRAVDLLRERARDSRLSTRERRHWKRVLQYARRIA